VRAVICGFSVGIGPINFIDIEHLNVRGSAYFFRPTEFIVMSRVVGPDSFEPGSRFFFVLFFFSPDPDPN
jgi:hypothetical protein